MDGFASNVSRTVLGASAVELPGEEASTPLLRVPTPQIYLLRADARALPHNSQDLHSLIAIWPIVAFLAAAACCALGRALHSWRGSKKSSQRGTVVREGGVGAPFTPRYCGASYNQKGEQVRLLPAALCQP